MNCHDDDDIWRNVVFYDNEIDTNELYTNYEVRRNEHHELGWNRNDIEAKPLKIEILTRKQM